MRDVLEMIVLIILLPFIIIGLVVLAAHAWAIRLFYDITEGRL